MSASSERTVPPLYACPTPEQAAHREAMASPLAGNVK